MGTVPHCSNCGKEIEVGSNFCNHCGHNITDLMNFQSKINALKQAVRNNKIITGYIFRIRENSRYENSL